MAWLPPGSLSPATGASSSPAARLPTSCHPPSQPQTGQPATISRCTGDDGYNPAPVPAGWADPRHAPCPGVPGVSELARGCPGAGGASLPELLEKSAFVPAVGTPQRQGPTLPPPPALIPTLKAPSRLLSPPGRLPSRTASSGCGGTLRPVQSLKVKGEKCSLPVSYARGARGRGTKGRRPSSTRLLGSALAEAVHGQHTQPFPVGPLD